MLARQREESAARIDSLEQALSEIRKEYNEVRSRCGKRIITCCPSFGRICRVNMYQGSCFGQILYQFSAYGTVVVTDVRYHTLPLLEVSQTVKSRKG